jgi:hypothetical protein
VDSVGVFDGVSFVATVWDEDLVAMLVNVCVRVPEAVANTDNEMLGVFVEDSVQIPESDCLPVIVAVTVPPREIVGSAEPVAVPVVVVVPDPDRVP